MKLTRILLLILVLISVGTMGFAAPADTSPAEPAKVAEAVAPAEAEPEKEPAKTPEKPAMKKPPRKPFTIATVMISKNQKKGGPVEWQISVKSVYKKVTASLEGTNITVLQYNALSPFLKKVPPAEFRKPEVVQNFGKQVGADYVFVLYDYGTKTEIGKEQPWKCTVQLYDVRDGACLVNSDLTTAATLKRGTYDTFIKPHIDNWSGAVRPTLEKPSKM